MYFVAFFRFMNACFVLKIKQKHFNSSNKNNNDDDSENTLTHVLDDDKLYRSDYQFNLIYFIIIINKYEHVL